MHYVVLSGLNFGKKMAWASNDPAEGCPRTAERLSIPSQSHHLAGAVSSRDK
jgi:hypothetical protein